MAQPSAMAPDSRRCVATSPHAFLGHPLVNVNAWKRLLRKTLSSEIDLYLGRPCFLSNTDLDDPTVPLRSVGLTADPALLY